MLALLMLCGCGTELGFQAEFATEGSLPVADPVSFLNQAIGQGRFVGQYQSHVSPTRYAPCEVVVQGAFVEVIAVPSNGNHDRGGRQRFQVGVGACTQDFDAGGVALSCNRRPSVQGVLVGDRVGRLDSGAIFATTALGPHCRDAR